MENHTPVIHLNRVQVHYASTGTPVLDIDHMTICRGQRVALIGPSGSGKTTLLRLLNGYIRPSRGQVDILGSSLEADSDRRRRAIRRRIGFVFQDFSLIERATVFQNVLWGRLGRANSITRLLGWFFEMDKVAAMAAIAEVDLLDQTIQRVDTLSGGQQQRVGVARVLAQEAEIILADEPVSNLDPAMADDVLSLLSEVSQRHGATLLMSLHQPRLAQNYADRIIGLRAGRIVYDQPAAAFNGLALGTVYGRDVEMELDPAAEPVPAERLLSSPALQEAIP